MLCYNCRVGCGRFRSGKSPLLSFERTRNLFGGFDLNTAETCEALLKGIVTELGYELYEVEFVKEYGAWTLTLYIDKEGGVSIDDCEKVSRAVEPILDEKDPIEQSYTLAVSSLGIDRPLKLDKDYERNMGAELEVKLYKPFMQKKVWVGTLASYDEDGFTIVTDDDEEVGFSKKEVALVKPYIRF